MQRSVLYTILFATAVCIVCAIVVSSAAVTLKPAQDINAALEKQRNVLLAAGLLDAGEKVDAAEVQRRFENIRMVVVNLETGEENADIDAATFDQARAAKDLATSTVAPANRALVQRLPDNVLVYEVLGEAAWSTFHEKALPRQGRVSGCLNVVAIRREAIDARLPPCFHAHSWMSSLARLGA